ncbi:MAG: ABC transporter permease [Ignavibacteriales bacterium]|nr:ABC transporter permease [Ignavibacteriales bacterium]
MRNLIKIAVRNLFRYNRRTLLTSSLIAFGVVLVIVFGGLAISFKTQMVGVITNTALGDLQIHKKGYVESIDNLPLNLSLSESEYAAVEQVLREMPEVEAYSPRIKFGAMISNYAQTSNIRLSAIRPEMEQKTVTDLVKRIKNDSAESGAFLRPGEIVVPENLMKGLGLNIGDEIVLIATNKDGSVNGIPVRISGVIESVLGPMGKDGYIHITDAMALLRMDKAEIIEIAVKLKRFEELGNVYQTLKRSFDSAESVAEVHTWEELSPFSSVARIVDLLIIVVKFILISIVLVSILNIMTMSVFERVAEIGTIAAIGTPPGRILSMFLLEGFSMGLLSTAGGVLVGLGIIWLMNFTRINFRFGPMDVSLAPSIPASEVIVTMVIVMLVSLFASFHPAYKAARMEPVDALGHV